MGFPLRHTRPGRETSSPDLETLRASMAANLAAFDRITVDRSDLRRAAVAILVSPHRGQPTYVLTRRAFTLRRGAGAYALPGGHVEPGEDALDAALRETAEEMGVALPRAAALGLLDDFVTLGGHAVTPVVLFSGEPVTLKPDPGEVHAAWRVPLSELERPGSPRTQPNPKGGPPILRLYARGGWINPPTAAFLYQFREVALGGRPTRVADVGQPAWTAR
jgi:8-oxo-dGTP pyrophosphatase MutT (NUDIX family)